MDEERRAQLRRVFDTVAGCYDHPALRFFPDSARHMATLLALRGDERVLDAACGTGHMTLALAHLLPAGRVTAVDFSPAMLDQARRKAATLNAANVTFLERDMTALGFPAGSFDAVTCAFGIFFVEDMEKQLAHLASVVRPGGRVAISCFQEDYFQPLRDLLLDRLVRYGVQLPPQHWKRIAHDAGCRELFAKAGLGSVRVERRNVGFHLETAEQWWDVIWNAGYRGMVGQLPAAELERFKREHLGEIEALRTEKGIWLDTGVLYTVGTVG